MSLIIPETKVQFPGNKFITEVEIHDLYLHQTGEMLAYFSLILTQASVMFDDEVIDMKFVENQLPTMFSYFLSRPADEVYESNLKMLTTFFNYFCDLEDINYSNFRLNDMKIFWSAIYENNKDPFGLALIDLRESNQLTKEIREERRKNLISIASSIAQESTQETDD